MEDPSSSSARRLLAFVHIEKAAGTTLHRIMQRNHPSYVIPTGYRWPAEPNDVLTATELRQMLWVLPFIRGVGGHTVRSYLDYSNVIGPSVDYVTFLREPVSRYISHYNHQRANMGIEWTMEEFLAEPRLHNVMTRKVCGAADVELAKLELAERFAFVGLTERFDESLLMLAPLVGLADIDLRYARENVARSAEYAAGTVDDADLDRIRVVNALDIELYEFVRDELFPASVERYGDALAGDVEDLRRSNESFIPPASTRAIARCYRWLVYRNVESVLRHRHHPDDEMTMRGWAQYRRKKLRIRRRARIGR